MVEFHGLSSDEAKLRLQRYGPNALPEEKRNPFVRFLKKFWGPVPWMLEVIIALELFLGKFAVGWIITALILFNALMSYFQEGKARKALSLLRDKLNVRARALRDGVWRPLPMAELVPGDVVLLRMGDIVPADVELLDGRISIDQSMMTGESFPVEPELGQAAYAGSIVKHGEAYVKVASTGKNTYFGRTAEIMRTAKTPSHLQKVIFSIVKSLVAFDIVLIAAVFCYAFFHGVPLFELIPFSLLILVASVPVALPATYTLSTALGAVELAKSGVLVTRLAAIEEAAAMNILCVDKTGTVTENVLRVSALQPFAPYSEEDLIALARFACEEATQDPIDLAILATDLSRKEPLPSRFSSAQRTQFIPFDPEVKCSEAHIRADGRELQVFKGAVSEFGRRKAEVGSNVEQELQKLTLDGSRVLGILVGDAGQFHFAGLIALNDPPRADSKQCIEAISALGVGVKMMTGDALQTALAVARQVGIDKSGVIAGIYPEDKFRIIDQLQKEGRICGMTGDGVNDAPALKKAEVGIAVSNAVDVAKASASIVLSRPGLSGIVDAIQTSRRIYQRMLTYTLNKIIKTLQISILLSLGLVLKNEFIISQLLIVLLLFANDFVTMSIATDRVSFSKEPDKWDIRRMILVGSLFATLILALSFGVLAAASRLPIPELQTLMFLTLVFTGQAIVYLVRERKHFWHSLPSPWMLGSTFFDIAIVSALAIRGILMAPIPAKTVFVLLLAVALYFLLLDFMKVRIFARFKL